MNNEKPSYEELELKIKKLELENLNLKTSQFEISKDTELAEKQLLKSNSIINSFFLNSTQYMGIIEIFPEKNDLRYIIINKSAGEYLQKRPDEVEGKLGTEIGVPENTLKYWIEQCQKSKDLDSISKFEYHRELDDGIHFLEASISMIQPMIYSFIVSDITEQKQREQELLDYQNFLSASQKVGNIGSYVTDLKTNTWKVSKEMNQVLGIDDSFPNTVESFSSLVHPDSIDAFNKYFEKIFSEFLDFNYEYKIIRPKDIAVRWVHCSGKFEFDSNGNPIYQIGTIQDITTMKEVSIELKNSKEKAEESDRLKSAFLQNLSHEIRTPLNAICGFAGMLNKPNLTDEKRDSFVSIIQTSSNQLLSIVSDVLTISSLETEQEKLNIEKVCINTIFIELLSIFKQQSLNQNISIYSKISLNDKQSEIYTDKTKITQILSNLISNAIKFTLEGTIDFGYSLKNNELEFFVKDCGIGIKPELQYKIFERFRQADLSINRKYGGTGLGLAISKGFIDLIGGKIWVESEEGKGATFYFTIPYNPVSKIESIEIKKESNPVLLIAEDEELNFLYIDQILNELNYTILHARNGQEAIDTFKENSSISVILMDIKMPIMDGYTAAKVIKELNPKIPIVAQSAYALEREIKKYKNVFDDYLTKPIGEKLLIEKINKFVKINN